MDTSRANLDQPQSNSKYILLTIILAILSVIGLFLFLKINSAPPKPLEPVAPAESSLPIVQLPTEIPPQIPTEPASSEPVESVEPINTEPVEVPAFQTYDGVADGFTLAYKSDREVYEIAESTGHRVVFYRAGSNLAVHVGSDWSWAHPGRELLNNLNISGQPAFRYDISAQTLVDVKYGDKFYTIQCIHNSDEALKQECEQLITSFKFL